jgi:hypothetical protein
VGKYFILEYEIVRYGGRASSTHEPWIVSSGPLWKLRKSLIEWVRARPEYSDMGWFSFSNDEAEIRWATEHYTKRVITKEGQEYRNSLTAKL